MSFKENITTRYTAKNKDIYDQVIDMSKSNGLAKSRAQLLLVERGLKYTNNPEPLVKEKVVYKDRPVEKKVYVDRPVEKKVYVDRPLDKPFHKAKPEPDYHIIDTELGQANKKGQRASDDKLTTSNEAKSDLASSKVALEEKKSSKESNAALGWIAGGILVAIVGAGIYFTK